jgi:hypothetical protein
MKYKGIKSVQEITMDTVQLIQFRLNEGRDYVWVSYHDKKGFLSITSSFGNYSYIWGLTSKRASIRDFFSQADTDYLAGKLFADGHNTKDGFDFCFAIQELKTELLAGRRNARLDRDESRKIFDELTGWQDTSDPRLSREGFYREYFEHDALAKWPVEPWHSNYGERPSTAWVVLKEEIIPLIQKHFTDELASHPLPRFN